MAKAAPPDIPSLADLRREIDRIDEGMHGLLMERGEIIDRRIAGWSAKAANALGAQAEVIAVPEPAFEGAALLISVPQGGSIGAIADALIKAGASVRATTLVGSHATRYRVSTQ